LSYVKDGDELLDHGCGNGRLVELFHERDIKYLGVDSSSELIALAQTEYPLGKFMVMDALDLTLPAESFDVVVSVAVSNHLDTLERQTKFLADVYRVLKPGGYLLLSNWNLWKIDNPKNLANFGAEKGMLTDADFEKKYHCTKDSLSPRDVLTVWGDSQEVLYYYAFTCEELEKLVKNAGFSLEKNFYSEAGEPTSQDLGSNIITVARK
jgi:2-polyprenyl-3-methyl-5-hydroxy-6-metoxy-1,4-benzoquinol methylase